MAPCVVGGAGWNDVEAERRGGRAAKGCGHTIDDHETDSGVLVRADVGVEHFETLANESTMGASAPETRRARPSGWAVDREADGGGWRLSNVRHRSSPALSSDRDVVKQAGLVEIGPEGLDSSARDELSQVCHVRCVGLLRTSYEVDCGAVVKHAEALATPWRRRRRSRLGSSTCARAAGKGAAGARRVHVRGEAEHRAEIPAGLSAARSATWACS